MYFQLNTTINLKQKLDRLYHSYHRREYVHPDPLEFLYAYKDLRDREIAGLIASSLAYGRVARILKSVSHILNITGPSPYLFVKETSPDDFRHCFAGFRHRFADETHVASLLIGAKHVIEIYGSFYECLLAGMRQTDETIIPAMSFFAEKLTESGGCGHLIPLPERGSACKRLNLFFRWMIRKDEVDPGGWDAISPSLLIIPLDVHIHRISLRLGLTARKQANMKTALEITHGFRKLIPEDPVRYDFALSRLGIRDDLNMEDVLHEQGIGSFV
jgi:uncharacterized protein (TIGR02757 family)